MVCSKKITIKDISGIDALYAAHKKARRGKGGKKDVILFEMNLAENLWILKTKLESGRYCTDGYHEFMVYEPKERLIQAASYADRVVQHSLCDNFLSPYVKEHVILDNAACQTGKGTHFALNRLEKHLRNFWKNHKDGYFLKADIRKYFPSIDHEVLKNMLRQKNFDGEIEKILEIIIDSFHNVGGEIPKGLPMGNQSSQQFAIFYLDPVDRLIKEKFACRYYSRYMDDMVVIHESREFLQKLLAAMKQKAAELRLEFNEKTQIIPLKNGIDYLGWHIWITKSGRVVRKLRCSTKRRIKMGLKKLAYDYRTGRADLAKARNVIASYNGHLAHGDTFGLRKNIYSRLRFCRD